MTPERKKEKIFLFLEYMAAVYCLQEVERAAIIVKAKNDATEKRYNER